MFDDFSELIIFPWLITLVICHPEVKNWIRFASFEEHNNYVSSCRKVYERAVEFFGEDNMDEKLYVAFSKFEERQKEVTFIYIEVKDHSFFYAFCNAR